MDKIGLIGMGNMGYAILKGMLKSRSGDQMVFTDVNRRRVSAVEKETGLLAVKNNSEVVKQVKYLVLAVKPQYYAPVLKEIKPCLTDRHVVISIAPGVTIDQLKQSLGEDKRIVRAMPNTPALIGEGMTGVSYLEEELNQEEQQTIEEIFTSVGKMELVEERHINAVTCASGSSPAYTYMFIEALADGAVKCGMNRETAYRMTAQAVLGSAKMILETGEHPGRLKDQVCSPGGTTIEGVAALEAYGFRNAILKATDACFEKCNNIK